MQTIKVSFVLKIKEDATDEEIQGWLEFELGTNGRLDGNNPLIKQSIEAESFSVEFDEH